MSRSIFVAAAVAAALLAPAAARAQDESVTSGPVTATLHYGADPLDVHGATLTITRAGAVAFDQAIPKVVCDGCVLGGGGSDDVQVRDLNGDGENEVVVTASTGGAECCVRLGVWDFPGSGAYRETDVDLGTVGFNLDDLDGDGVPEFNSFDSRFNALFTDTADEFPPPDIEHWLVQDGEPVFGPVTTAFPSVIRANASEAKKRLSRMHRRDPNAAGLLTTYNADQLLLGKGSTGLKEFDRQARRGVLGSSAAAKKARTKMLKFLHKLHYR